MNFLEFCQAVTRESGTVAAAGPQPQTVTDQIGRLAKHVEWTATAWIDIQRSRRNWRWMRRTWQDQVAPGVAVYTPASFNLVDWGGWVVDRPLGEAHWHYPMTLYPIGKKEREAPLAHIEWEVWRRVYDRGVHPMQQPREYAIGPRGEFCIGPTPDAAYVVRGEYRQAPQRLALDTDVPAMPEEFHEAIVYRALQLLSEHDEGVIMIAAARQRLAEVMSDLRLSQLEPISIGGESIA